ncbi:phage holin family protein [Clostridium sp.]|uniref:phage holin family protein n=1 Tax=Clostridium sp. TaxID=1506 RepID=UPI002638B2DB|nr:phage holin family protein [Clostridium sp.]
MEKGKSIIIGFSAIIGGFVSEYLGGFDKMLKALIILMIADYVSGLIVALVFKNSTKTETGGASSQAGFKGLFKKFAIILLIAVMVQIDLVLNTNNFFREAAIWGFLANEFMSLLENVGLMGFKNFPNVFSNALDALNKKAEGNKGQE